MTIEDPEGWLENVVPGEDEEGWQEFNTGAGKSATGINEDNNPDDPNDPGDDDS